MPPDTYPGLSNVAVTMHSPHAFTGLTTLSAARAAAPKWLALLGPLEPAPCRLTTICRPMHASRLPARTVVRLGEQLVTT